MQVHLDPARGACHVLTVVLRPPALDEAHSYRAHLGQFVNRLETLVYGEGQELCELLVVKYLQTATRRDLAHGGWVETVRMIALPALDKDGVIA